MKSHWPWRRGDGWGSVPPSVWGLQPNLLFWASLFSPTSWLIQMDHPLLINKLYVSSRPFPFQKTLEAELLWAFFAPYPIHCRLHQPTSIPCPLHAGCLYLPQHQNLIRPLHLQPELHNTFLLRLSLLLSLMGVWGFNVLDFWFVDFKSFGTFLSIHFTLCFCLFLLGLRQPLTII